MAVLSEYDNVLENIRVPDYGAVQYKITGTNVKKFKNVVKQRKRNRLLQLFRFADSQDKCLMIVGACCAAIQGSCFPILSVVFGSMTNTFLLQYTRGSENVSQSSGGNESNGTSVVSDDLGSTQSVLDTQNFGNSMMLYSNFYFVIALVALITGFLQTFCWEVVAERQVYRLRKAFFTQLLRQDIGWYDRNKKGDLSVKLSDDLERIREGVGIKFSLVIQYISTFVSGILIGFYVNWRLTTMVAAVGPVLIGVSTYIAKVTANSSAREQLKYAFAGSIAEEVLANIKTVAAFCKEEIEMKRYKTALEKGRRVAMRKYLIMSCGLAIVYFMMYASYGLVFYFGTALVQNNLCTPGSIFTVFFSVMAGAFSIGNALPFINSVSAAVGASAVIFDVIEREPHIDPYSKKGFKPSIVVGYIELNRISFKYPARPNVEVLHDVSLKIEQGKIIAFVGSSGSGKSTLISLILRFYDPNEGYITLDGIPLQQLNVNWLRNQIGIVAQEPILFSASIADNIRYGRSDVTQKEIEEAAKIANAHHFISNLPNGYLTLAGNRGSQLSGGQRQRICIARALIRNPKILLLDEATSALDAYSEGIVQKALEKAMHGRTTIVVAHRLSTVRNADMIYVMKNGRICEYGKHEDLINRRSLYYNLVFAQAVDSCIEETPLNCYRDEEFRSNHLEPSSRSSSVTSQADGSYKADIECAEEHLPDVTVWQLVKYNSKEWLRLLIGILACTVTGAVTPTFSIFYSQMFVTFILPEEQLMASARFWALMLGILAVVSSVAMFAQTLCLTSAAEKLIMRMRSKAFNNILRQPIAWFDLPSSSTGYLVTRLARDAPLVKAAAGLRVGHVLTALVTMVSGVGIAVIYGWKLTLILSVSVPFIAGAAYQQSKILRRHQTQDASHMDVAGQIASECVQNIRTIQGLGNEKLFIHRYMKSLSSPFKEAKKDAAYFGIVFSFSQSAIYLLYAAAFRFGYYLVSSGEMQPSDIYKVFFSLSFCATSVGNTISYMQDFSKAKYAARRMIQLINRKSEIDPTVQMKTRPEVYGNIEFADVLFTYPSRVESNVLRGMSFTLGAGKCLALVGESGSGKSTVVAILERFYNPNRGSIIVDGHEISSIDLHHLRHNIGLVTQEPNLFDRTIKDNIAYGLNYDLKNEELMRKIVQVSKSVNLHNFVKSLPQGYDTMVGDKGTQLSGGQKQRINLARALIKNPKILLLDEATSALDTECEKIVQEALDRARNGRTCITIAHRLSTIQNADVIAVVHKGRIIEQGEHKELIAQGGYYYKLTERQHML